MQNRPVGPLLHPSLRRTRIPRELDSLGVRRWLAELQDSGRSDGETDRELANEALAARREAHRELARRRRHALRLAASPTPEARNLEAARRTGEKARHPWPDHWQS